MGDYVIGKLGRSQLPNQSKHKSQVFVNPSIMTIT